jgi:flagellar motor protein MotB
MVVMDHRILPTLCALVLGACASTESKSGSNAPGSQSVDEDEFQLNDSTTAKDAHGEHPSKIERTATEAAVRLFVVEKDKSPVPGIVIKLTGSKGKSYYTEETDAMGYTELLLPIGDSYEMVYLGLGRRDVKKKVTIDDEQYQNFKLTLVYKSRSGSKATGGFVLDGVEFDTAKATIRPESFPRLDKVLEYMEHKKSARIEISGHTDNEGNAKNNKTLSHKRAQALQEVPGLERYRCQPHRNRGSRTGQARRLERHPRRPPAKPPHRGQRTVARGWLRAQGRSLSNRAATYSAASASGTRIDTSSGRPVADQHMSQTLSPLERVWGRR